MNGWMNGKKKSSSFLVHIHKIETQFLWLNLQQQHHHQPVIL
jgi:hypothetical protein